MIDIKSTQKAIREEKLAGWLFSNLSHRDEISDLVLGIPREKMNTRPWFCIVYPDRPPFKLVHAIERGILDNAPGSTTVYASREELLQALSSAFPREPVGAQFSVDFPVCSFLDHGTTLLLERAGANLVSSENLIVRRLGSLDDEGIRSHQAAAAALYDIVHVVWRRIGESLRSGKALLEVEVRGWMEELIAGHGLARGEPPLVAAGLSSADPHYAPEGSGRLLSRNEGVQLDIWARERGPGAVFADISWVGVLSAKPDTEALRAFDAVVQGRETAVEAVRGALEEGRTVSGADVDRAVRARLKDLGYAGGLRHRTGHSIGGRVHGFGVNLDSVEFPDERRLSEGACFSIEPGVYLSAFGMRSEIDAYIHGGRLAISGGDRQTRLLTLE